MEGCVEPKTRGDYLRHHRVFNNYRGTLPQECDPGAWFELCLDNRQRTQEMVLFIKYLYRDLGYRGQAVSSLIPGIVYCLDLAGEDSGFLKSTMVRRAVKACGRTPEESRASNILVSAREKEPVTGDIVREVRTLYWEGRGWETKADLDAKGSWLAVALGFDSGTRIGNVTRKDGKDGSDHCIRTVDVELEMRYPNGSTRKMRGSQSLKLEIAGGLADPLRAVERAWLTLLSSKTTKHLKAQQFIPKLLDRRTEDESQLLEDLVEWMWRSGTMDNDELLTRYVGSHRRSTTRKDASTALKAGAMAIGLNPSNYSSKSLRNGLATVAHEADMPDDELNARGGWTRGSKVPKLFYTTFGKEHNRGGMSLLKRKKDSKIYESTESDIELAKLDATIKERS